MPLPKNLSAYTHVKQVLDAALPFPKAIFTLPTPSAAIRWRQEAYYFRRRMQDNSNQTYDNFILKLEGPKVIIEKRVVPGTLTTHDGTVIEPAAETPLDVDMTEMERYAFNLAKKLGLEIEDD